VQSFQSSTPLTNEHPVQRWQISNQFNEMPLYEHSEHDNEQEEHEEHG